MLYPVRSKNSNFVASLKEIEDVNCFLLSHTDTHAHTHVHIGNVQIYKDKTEIYRSSFISSKLIFFFALVP